MVTRQFPRPREIFDLMRFKAPDPNGTRRRLASALTISDLRDIARKRTPKAAFDYTDGGSEFEVTLRRLRQAFEDVEFHPAILQNVEQTDTSTTIFGGPSTLPFGIAPTGFGRLMHTEGEVAVSGAAGAAGIPYSLSTFGTTSIQDVKSANPDGRNWFQLYPLKDRALRFGLVEAAAANAFDTLIVTVDTAATGSRFKDKRNGFSVPPQITLSTVVDAIPRPWWWWDFLTTPKMEFASLTSAGPTMGSQFAAAVDPTFSTEELIEIRDAWSGAFVVKGIQTVADAKKLAGIGVDGIVLSNHGGRQLDRAPLALHVLPDVVREVGDDLSIVLDSGIMNGADIVAAIALGADFTLVGRATLYGLMAGGRAGVTRAIEILSDEIVRAMKLLGVSTIAELEPAHVTLLRRLVPMEAGHVG